MKKTIQEAIESMTEGIVTKRIAFLEGEGNASRVFIIPRRFAVLSQDRSTFYSVVGRRPMSPKKAFSLMTKNISDEWYVTNIGAPDDSRRYISIMRDLPEVGNQPVTLQIAGEFSVQVSVAVLLHYCSCSECGAGMQGFFTIQYKGKSLYCSNRRIEEKKKLMRKDLLPKGHPYFKNVPETILTEGVKAIYEAKSWLSNDMEVSKTDFIDALLNVNIGSVSKLNIKMVVNPKKMKPKAHPAVHFLYVIEALNKWQDPMNFILKTFRRKCSIAAFEAMRQILTQ